MITIRIHKGLGIVLLVLAILALGTGWAVASGDDIVYQACANVSNNGALHYVAADEPCGQNEVRLVWNQQGPPGVDGQDGAPGRDGRDGLHCWDLNGNGVANPRPEDRNGDGKVDVLDCQVSDAVWRADLAAEATARTNGDDSLQTQVSELQTLVSVLQATIEDQQTRLGELEDLLVHFGRDGDEISITGANLHVVNGTGGTNWANGLGNIIIGYNEPRDSTGLNDDRSGSHMLVLGQWNNYSSYGGIVTGRLNTTSGPFSSVTGGHDNVASGDESSISGGSHNEASGFFSSVTGGDGNVASGANSSVSGGFKNKASNTRSSVTGGSNNEAKGLSSWVSGGRFNQASADYSSISGGYENLASEEFASVTGGYGNEASGFYSAISGGYDNLASGNYSSVTGGYGNEASRFYSSVSGGLNRSADGDYDWVAGLLFADQ